MLFFPRHGGVVELADGFLGDVDGVGKLILGVRELSGGGDEAEEHGLRSQGPGGETGMSLGSEEIGMIR